MNRLHLDFTINGAVERKKFVEEYLQRINFKPNPTETETIANYILWGSDDRKNRPKNKPSNKSVAKNEGIEIKTRYGTWDTKKKTESLEALVESPTFNEASLLRTPTHYINEKFNFSRSKARKTAPPETLRQLEDLWRQIDELDLLLCYFDLRHKKRKTKPREELTQKFTPKERKELVQKAISLNQYAYLKKRHELVELRRQQYTLKDTYAPQLLIQATFTKEEPETITWGEDIDVYPLGIYSAVEAYTGFEESIREGIRENIRENVRENVQEGVDGAKPKKTIVTPIGDLIFKENFNPAQYTSEELQQISDFYWLKQKESTKRSIDFRKMEDVYNILLSIDELEESARRAYLNHDTENNTAALLNTLVYYIKKANLSAMHKEILNLKVKKVRNQDIASYINKKYGKSYLTNYISTIFRQKIIKDINTAAQHHSEIIANIFFPENFKYCNTCGQALLLNAENFVRKSKSTDGFSSRCKVCDKKIRERKKKKKGD